MLLQFGTPAVYRAFSAHRANAQGPQKKGASTLRAEAPSEATHDPVRRTGGVACAIAQGRHRWRPVRVGHHSEMSQREHFDQIVELALAR